jgi:hypothetical protein
VVSAYFRRCHTCNSGLFVRSLAGMVVSVFFFRAADMSTNSQPLVRDDMGSSALLSPWHWIFLECTASPGTSVISAGPAGDGTYSR